MTAKRDGHHRYKIRGTDVVSLGRGFDELQMPEHRRQEATAIVSEVLETNGATDFYWYMPASTPEISCYWDEAEKNLLWITSGEVHVPSDDPDISLPARPVTWSKSAGQYVGWLLPGATAGSGGGSQKPQVDEVLCPETFVKQPAGVLCPHCEVMHTS